MFLQASRWSTCPPISNTREELEGTLLFQLRRRLVCHIAARTRPETVPQPLCEAVGTIPPQGVHHPPHRLHGTLLPDVQHNHHEPTQFRASKDDRAQRTRWKRHLPHCRRTLNPECHIFGSRFVDEVKKSDRGISLKSGLISQSYNDHVSTTVAQIAPTGNGLRNASS